MARERTQAWGFLSATVPTATVDQSMETESSPPVVNLSDYDHSVVTTSPGPAIVVTATTAPCSTVPLVTSVPPTTVTASPVTDVTPANPVASVSATSTMKTPTNIPVTMDMYCAHLYEHFPSTEFPRFDGVTGKEWDSKLRSIYKGELRRW